MEGVAQIDHTGDIGLLVSAENLEALFEKSAFGMFEVIADLRNVDQTEKVEVRVEAEDLETLFIRWLSELNFIHITQELIFSRFEIDALDEKCAVGRAWGEKTDFSRHTIFTEVKAVTYHDLSIKKSGGVWQARFIFDM